MVKVREMTQSFSYDIPAEVLSTTFSGRMGEGKRQMVNADKTRVNG